MEFDEYGHLFPYQIIETDIITFQEMFVINFNASNSRFQLFHKFNLYIEELKQLLQGSFYLWIDGSFITQKPNPKDIDLLVFVESNVLIEKEKQLSCLKNKFKPEIDSYFIEISPKEHPRYFLFEMNKKEWFFTFSTARNFKNKGVIQINY
jgi:hypothetical protein